MTQPQYGQQNAVVPNLYTSNNKDPYGLQGGFLDRENPVFTFDEEIERMKREADLLKKEQTNLISVKTEIGIGGVTTSYDFGGVPVQNISHQLLQRQSQADFEEEDRYMAKQEMKQRKMYAAANDSRTKTFTNTVKQTFSLADGFKIQQNTTNAGIQSLIKPTQQESSNLKYARSDINGSRIASKEKSRELE